jgi:putative Mn2+ efflux pump MntP
MIYGVALIIVGMVSFFVSIKRKYDEEDQDMYDKTNKYGGILGGIVCVFLGVFIIIQSI